MFYLEPLPLRRGSYSFFIFSKSFGTLHAKNHEKNYLEGNDKNQASVATVYGNSVFL
jgi:hypothetical protein